MLQTIMEYFKNIIILDLVNRQYNLILWQYTNKLIENIGKNNF